MSLYHSKFRQVSLLSFFNPALNLNAIRTAAILSAATAVALTTFSNAVNADTVAPADNTNNNSNINSNASSAIKELGTVTVTSTRPSSLPTQIPSVFEAITSAQIEQTINATDSADALKYLPSLNVRKRYIGDYNHAVLASRASGTGNSARSLVYADGILLSNLLGNGASYTPRWGLVTPNEIERADVLYGPFSAAYSGNSVGAVVDYQTRMPKQFEAYVKLGAFNQHYREYQTNSHFGGNQASVSLGSKSGNLSWFVNAERLKSSGQPLVFANRLVSSSTTPTAAGVAVTGAITGLANPQNAPWVLLGATGQSETEQQHLKIKLAYDFSNTLHASYTVGLWDNNATTTPYSYLKNAANNSVYTGAVIINGRQYTLNAADFSYSKTELQHWIHGINLKSNTGGVFDWELTASLYSYSKDLARGQANLALPMGQNGGAGRITDLNGTGWNTLNAKGIWRPNTAHVVEFGAQQDSYQSRSVVSNTSDWVQGVAETQFSKNTGDTYLRSVWAQDYWKISPTWNATIGARFENWQARNGLTANTTTNITLPNRQENFISPKAALAYQLNHDWSLKASVGRAVRMPTATELYQGSITGTTIVNNNPNLKPEQSITQELTAERDLNNGLIRLTAFNERTHDALYNQTNYAVIPNITNVQNVGTIRTQGLEMVYQATDIAKNIALKGLDLSTSITYADSVIISNPNNPASEGKQQPRVPKWRANFLATYAINHQWSSSLGVRYSGKQYGQLDNSDTNSNAYQGFSAYCVADIRVQYRYSPQLTGSLGVDNLNNAKYWAFHPYPQRTIHTDFKYSF